MLDKERLKLKNEVQALRIDLRECDKVIKRLLISGFISLVFNAYFLWIILDDLAHLPYF